MYIILNWYCPAMMSLSRKHVHYVITLYCYMWHYNVILYVKRESLPLQVIRRWKGSMLCLETNKKIYILLLFTQFLQTITVFWIFKKKPSNNCEMPAFNLISYSLYLTAVPKLVQQLLMEKLCSKQLHCWRQLGQWPNLRRAWTHRATHTPPSRPRETHWTPV